MGCLAVHGSQMLTSPTFVKNAPWPARLFHFSHATVLPINKILLNYRDQIVHNRKLKPQSASASSVSPGTVSILSASEDARMLTLLTRWQEMHRWRIVAGLGAWSLSLAAIVVSV